jgi:RNA polymerase sigma-70 factor (ECF subfamily)
VDINSWIDDPSCRRQYAGTRTTALDDLLIAVGAKHDGQAFAVLFNHFRPRVQSQLVRFGLAPVAAEDVAQDVMETIWSKAHLYDPRKSGATTWVQQIARNRSIDLKRRCREFSVAEEDFHDIPDPAVANDDCLDAAQREARVRVALDALPGEQLTLVQLAFFEGLSHSTIARRMNLPLGTVKSRLRLAFVCLRRLLLKAGVTEAAGYRSGAHA